MTVAAPVVLRNYSEGFAIWSVEKGTILHTEIEGGQGGAIDHTVSYSPDGRVLAVGRVSSL